MSEILGVDETQKGPLTIEEWYRITLALRASEAALREENEKLRKALENAKRPHLWLDEDCWYSCPLALDERGETRCCNDDEVKRGACNCGADDFNAKLAATLNPSGERDETA